MGGNHVRTLHNLTGVELGVVVDNDITRAERLADQFGCVAVSSITELDADRVDGAVVAAPSQFHVPITEALLDKGIDVLVEKPIALHMNDAEHLDKTAAALGRVLMVGHVELFNPAIRELRKVINGTDIRSMRFNRLGYVADPSRLYHDAVYDLMIHDIAIALSLAGKDETTAQVISSVGRNDTPAAPDPVEANIVFDNGTDAHFRTSRAYTGGKVRTASVETMEGVIEADLLTRIITRRVAGEGRFNVGDGVFTQDVKTAFCFPQSNEEPLRLELSHFVDCIRGRAKPEDEGVSGRDGIATIAIAQEILKKTVLVR
jgi:predicted dehydrogenase